MSWNEDGLELVACIRHVLGLRPLPPEPVSHELVTLDGKRWQSLRGWSIELGLQREAVRYRLNRLQRELAEGRQDAYVRALQPRDEARNWTLRGG